METMKDVLCFLNRPDFLEKITGDLVEETRCIKQQKKLLNSEIVL